MHSGRQALYVQILHSDAAASVNPARRAFTVARTAADWMSMVDGS
jgi:hypothetical protein